MALTHDETRLLAYLYAARHDEEDREAWFEVEPELFAEAARLWERGWLTRRWQDDELVYRLSGSAMTAIELAGVTASASDNVN